MLVTHTDYENYVTHIICEPCVLSVQISTLSPHYERLLRTELTCHAACEAEGQPCWEDLDVRAYKRVMNTARGRVGLPAVS